MKTVLTLFALLLLFSCQKDRVKLNDHPNFVGNYEWYHSYGVNSNESESYQSISDQYGIRIKENGKVEFYANGDLVCKSYVNAIYDTTIAVNKNEETLLLVFTGEDFNLINYPFEGHLNQFKKHE